MWGGGQGGQSLPPPVPLYTASRTFMALNLPPPALSDVSPTSLNKKTKKSTLTVTLAVSGRAVRFVGLYLVFLFHLY